MQFEFQFWFIAALCGQRPWHSSHIRCWRFQKESALVVRYFCFCFIWYCMMDLIFIYSSDCRWVSFPSTFRRSGRLLNSTSQVAISVSVPLELSPTRWLVSELDEKSLIFPSCHVVVDLWKCCCSYLRWRVLLPFRLQLQGRMHSWQIRPILGNGRQWLRGRDGSNHFE